MAETKKKANEKEMSFLDHLEELRWHIIRSIIAVMVLSIVIFLFKDLVFDKIILAPKKASFFTYQFFCGLSETTCFNPPDFKLMPRQLGEEFFTHLKVSIWLGII
ncbi:MAG: twin-arginine translocase subunit TatC, partial [Saprospiraceae bacterium]|nr:twin-arginine translocase subunit TatC [Saprospiraceae bacterium]